MADEKEKTVGVFGVIWFLIVLVLKACAIALAIATPVLGVWVSSSLAAYLNGPIWATILVGLLFFPLLPLAWEGFAAWRRSRKEEKRDHVLTFTDRLVLRTLFLNFSFLVVLLLARPEAGFTALQARGDWMLESVRAPWADSVRPHLFRTADGLEWLYLAFRDNPYADDNPDEGTLPDALPTDTSDTTGGGATGQGDAGVGTPSDATKTDQGIGGRWGGVTGGGQQGGPGDAGPAAEGDGGAQGSDQGGSNVEPTPSPPTKVRVLWPTPDVLHPVVKSMPSSAETSIKTVAEYINAHESDELGRVRAAHDYVADRIAYDAPALKLPRLPPQNAERIFKTKVGVCAGYARVLRALGKAMGLNVVYVVGDSRDEDGDIAGGGHAWNAVKLDGAWHLMDATWDSGSVGEGGFSKGFTTRYFLTPPDIFGIDHFPDQPQWQLRKTPLSRGDFIRLPMLDPRFFIAKMELLEPTRSQITVEDEVVIRVKNPNNLYLLASVQAFDNIGGGGTRCQVNPGSEVRILCHFATSGNWRVKLFMNRQRYGSFAYAGQIMVNSR